MKLYKVTFPQLWEAVAADDEDEAAREGFYPLKEIAYSVNPQDFRVEEISPDDPELQDYLDNWGGDLEDLDPVYLPLEAS